MSDEELDKLAAAMKNVRPSEKSRRRGVDAAMAAFETEFAAAEKDQTQEEISHSAQGSAVEPRPIGQITRTGRVQTFGSDMMSKINTLLTFTPRTKMMLGSCTAALIAAVVFLPQSLNQSPISEKFDNISAEMAPAGEEVIVTGRTRNENRVVEVSPPAVSAPVEADKKTAVRQEPIQSVNDLLEKVRKDSAAQSAENAMRETAFKARRDQQASRLANVPSAPSQSIDEYRAALQQVDNIRLSTNPTETKPVPRRVLKTPARTVERVVPSVTRQETRRIQKPDGTYETVSVNVVVQEASTELVTLPPVYEIISVQPESRDQFKDFEINPVTSAKETPVSTFSIDVDTASYSFLRSSINRGQLPPRSSIRLEEMINYFPYDYEAPTSPDEPFKANVTVTPTPWNADTKLMHIGIKGYVPDADEKPDSNIVFLIDTSGSMSAADKLPLLVNSFKLLLGTLGEDDTVSIVTYAGSAGTVLEPTPASDKSRINAALNRLSSGGSTAGAAGLELAYEKAQENFDEDGINRIILATDGDFNVGFSSPDEMKEFIEKKRETGIFLSVLGFGNGNYNDHLMQSLAQNGNGVAAYIDSLAEANKVLADEAGSALITIAKDVKIQVEFNPETISEYRLIGYETRALKREDFNNDTVDAGEIGAGHSVTAIYELTPVGSPAQVVDDLRYVSGSKETTGSDEFAFVKIRHKLPNANKSTLQTFPVGKSNERRVRRASDDMRFATAVAAVGQKLRGDAHLQDFSYADAIKLASSARGDDEHGYRAEFIQLVRLMENVDDRKNPRRDQRR